MEPLTKKFADFVGFDFRYIADPDTEIADYNEAVRFCLENRGFYFQTHEVSFVTINGEEFRTDPKNHSERIYVGVPEIHRGTDVRKKLEESFAAAMTLSEDIDDVVMNELKYKLAGVKENGPDAFYISEPGSRDGYIRLNPGDMVYDMYGRQMWPKVTAPPAPEPMPLSPSSAG